MKSNAVKNYLSREGTSLRIAWENWVLNLLPDSWMCNRCFRPFLARKLGMCVGKGAMLRKGGFYGNLRNICLGDRVGISREVFLDAYDTITIGNNVGMGFRVTFVTSSHDMTDGTCRTGDVLGRPIVIEDGVWVGGNVTIGPGVTIGAGSVIGAGAVVMRSIPPYSLAVGVPARVAKRLEDVPVCTESQTHESVLSGP